MRLFRLHMQIATMSRLSMITGALLGCLILSAQPSSINFHKIGFQEGLHDGIIRCIGQDKLGYIWIGTAGALNRYDGKKITQYTNIPGDSSSPYATQIRCLQTDKTGRFWIGTELGLMEYDFKKGNFIRIHSLKNLFITGIESLNDSILFLNTRKGLYRYNTNSQTAFSYSRSASPAHALIPDNIINSICLNRGNLYLGTRQGIVLLDTRMDSAVALPLPGYKGIPVADLDEAPDGSLWLYTGQTPSFLQLSPDHRQVTVLDANFKNDIPVNQLTVIKILADHKDGFWCITEDMGLFRYQASTHQVSSYRYDIHYPSGPSSNGYRCIYQDPKGLVWLGCYVEGVNYFEPEDNFFTSILPFPDERSKVGRAVAIDLNGEIWMGNHDGLSCYNPQTGSYKVWYNQPGKSPVLYSNTIRSLECDEENNIWIGTGNGVNKYDRKTGRIEFVPLHQLPGSFYNAINKDRSGNIWFCTNDSASLYWYSMKTRTYHNISAHPQLKKVAGYSPASYLMEDSKGRLWISFSRKGAVMFDKGSGNIRHYQSSGSGRNEIIGNQVIEIKEDKKGVIWLATFNGLTGINTEANTFVSFNNRNGLPGNMTSTLAIDSIDRIWVGVNGGLTLISADRKQFTSFSTAEGLPSVGFHEHASYSDQKGGIIMPTYYGYFRFEPAHYIPRKEGFGFYVNGYSVFDKRINRINEADSLAVLKLKADQNSFTFHMAALNYLNPSQTWFVYKLEGFDKDWHYSKDPKAVYTNVPGGHFIFRYRALTDLNNMDSVPIKQQQVFVATYFYKTTWFRIVVICIIVLLLYGLYRYRSRQQDQVYHLNERAQLLEKEKALVMYESLKQQLNPHFLFNSLTSLNSLISTDQKEAAKFLDSLSKTYRYILKSRDHETVSLGDEIRFAQNYVSLQQTRFEKGFEVQFDIAEDFHHRKIVPVTLQNLIENAIKHNIIDEESPLEVRISIQDDYLVVANNLQKKRMVESSNRQGLSNMRSLYQYLSHQPMEIMESETEFIVKLPLL